MTALLIYLAGVLAVLVAGRRHPSGPLILAALTWPALAFLAGIAVVGTLIGGRR